MTDADFSALLVPVATYFWGEPTKVTDHEVRWGNQGSKVVNVEKGSWKDFESDAGGGLFRLIEAEAGLGDGDKSGCLKFLEQEGFIAKREQHRGQSKPSQPMPPKEQRSLPAPPPNGKKVEAAVYDYTDSDGGLIYQVVRIQVQLPDGTYQPTKDGKGLWKTFLQRRPSGLGDKSMVWGLSAGEFMRKAGENWRKYDEQTFKDYGYAEKRWFDSEVTHSIYRHPAVEIAISENKAVYICEGEKDVHTLEALGLCATTNSGGAKHWTPELAGLFNGADIVVLADNDEAGRDRGEAVAKSLQNVAKRVRVLNLADHVPALKAKGDVTDWVEDCAGTAEQFEALVGGLADWKASPPKSRFNAVGLHELSRPDLQHDFLIDGFLDRRGVAMMPGASGSGKTFITLEIAMCTALGRKFWDMKVKPGTVIYQAGEGAAGAAKRMQGWMLDRGVPDPMAIPFKMLPQKVNLFADDKDTDDLIAECRAWAEYFGQPMRLLIIDTFNKAITGANENAGQDMSKVLARAERISDELDCCVLIPLHKSKKGEIRGHTSITGDVANVLNVTELMIRDNNRRVVRTLAMDKNKDGEKGSPLRFVLRQVVLSDGPDGKPRTTCVVDRPDGNDDELAMSGRLSFDQVFVLRMLKETISREGINAPDGARGVPQGRQVVEQKLWQETVRREWFFRSPETEPEKRAKELRDLIARTGKALKFAGYIDRDEVGPEGSRKAYVWWTGKDDKPKPIVKSDPLPDDVKTELADMEGMPF